MAGAFSTPNNKKISLILLTICVLLAFAAAAVGIDDNLPGIVLAFLASTAFVLAFVHPWRAAKKFLFLLLVSVLGFVLYIILIIILDSITQNPATSSTLKDLIESPLANALSLIISMLCPAAFIIGAVGSIVMFIRNRRQSA